MPVKRAKVPVLGSVSCGTLRTQDLLAAFADALAYYRPRGHSTLIREARAVVDCIHNDKRLPSMFGDQAGMSADEMGSYLIDELTEKLNAIAPEYVRFGAHDGDGADFGFWPVDEAIDHLDAFQSANEARTEGYFGDFRLGENGVYRRHNNGRIVPLLTF